MSDELVPEKLFYLRLLNDNLLKSADSQYIVKNVRISPAGVLEAERVYADVSFTTKTFYNGEYYLTELSEEEVEDFRTPECEHDHDEDEE